MDLRIIFAFLIVAVVIVVIGGLVLTAVDLTGVLDTWQMQMETANANARADELAASAADKEAEARLVTAEGDFVIKQSQADNATSNNATTNFLMLVWGVVGPTMTPVTFFLGMAVGGIVGGSVVYAVCTRNELNRNAVEDQGSDAPPSPFRD